jgi:hypothetical protein
MPMWSDARDVEDRGEHLRHVLFAVWDYVQAILSNVAQNVPRDLDLRQIDALACDLLSEVAGALNLAAGGLPGRRS